MAPRTRKSRTTAPAAVETAELPEPKQRYVLYSEWLATNKGYADLDPATLQVALANYSAFQKSPENRANNEQSKAAREAAAAERPARATRTTKATKATTAAADSKPTTKRTTKRATKATTGKTTGRRTRKAATETADAPY